MELYSSYNCLVWWASMCVYVNYSFNCLVHSIGRVQAFLPSFFCYLYEVWTEKSLSSIIKKYISESSRHYWRLNPCLWWLEGKKHMGNVSYKMKPDLGLLLVESLWKSSMGVPWAVGQQIFVECLGAWVPEDRYSFVSCLSGFFWKLLG